MDLEAFRVEAERLARTGVIMREGSDGSPIGYWHGLNCDALCISVAFDGHWLNVHLDDNDGGHVEHSNEPAVSGVPLIGEPYTSLPPVDGVFLRGSNGVGEFLRKHDWPRSEPFNDNFPDHVPSEYERIWRENCPLHRSGVAAVSGGWHFPWPDGDWQELIDHELVVWTLRDSEP